MPRSILWVNPKTKGARKGLGLKREDYLQTEFLTSHPYNNQLEAAQGHIQKAEVERRWKEKGPVIARRAIILRDPIWNPETDGLLAGKGTRNAFSVDQYWGQHVKDEKQSALYIWLYHNEKSFRHPSDQGPGRAFKMITAALPYIREGVPLEQAYRTAINKGRRLHGEPAKTGVFANFLEKEMDEPRGLISISVDQRALSSEQLSKQRDAA